MERTITIVNTTTQATTAIKADINTVAELKNEMCKAGINYAGMEIHEALSKSILTDDASQLPNNVMYKGRRTDDIIISLTQPSKKTTSGAHRSYLYKTIKDNNLQDEVFNTYGKSFIFCTNEQLEDIIDEYFNSLEDDDDDINEESYSKEDILLEINKLKNGISSMITTAGNLIEATDALQTIAEAEEDDDLQDIIHNLARCVVSLDEVEGMINDYTNAMGVTVNSPYNNEEICDILNK